MAMEYFKEHIEPTLPEITFFGAEFLDFTTPFTSEYLYDLHSGLKNNELVKYVKQPQIKGVGLLVSYNIIKIKTLNKR